MADKEISALTSASALDGTELIHVVQSGNSRKATVEDLISVNPVNGGMELIGVYDLSTNTLDAGNEIDIDVSNYAAVFGSYVDGTVASADAPGVRVSDDGGASFYSGASDYSYWNFTATGGASHTSIDELLIAPFNTSNGMSQFEIMGLNTNGAVVTSKAAMMHGSSGSNQMTTCQTNATTSPVNALRFFARSGNAFTGGKLMVWGIRSIDASPKTKTETVTTIAGGETEIDFTGIPSDAEDITLTFNGVSLSGTDDLLIQLGDSGGFETTGYVSTSLQQDNAGGSAGANSTSGLVVYLSAAGEDLTGRLALEESDTNEWVGVGQFRQSTTLLVNSSGDKTLSATLDRIRVTRTGTDTFDAGKVKLSYRTAS